MALTQNHSSLATSEEQMYDLITKELIESCSESSEVKAGFVGEVGSTWPIEGGQMLFYLNQSEDY